MEQLPHNAFHIVVPQKHKLQIVKKTYKIMGFIFILNM